MKRVTGNYADIVVLRGGSKKRLDLIQFRISGILAERGVHFPYRVYKTIYILIAGVRAERKTYRTQSAFFVDSHSLQNGPSGVRAAFVRGACRAG